MQSRRQFLKNTGTLAGGILLPAKECLTGGLIALAGDTASADYTLHIMAAPIEIAPKRIVSAVTYNRQLPGPLLRFKEGRLATIDVFNHTDTPEQLHWHGQQVPVEVDGAAEEGTPFIPAQGQRRIVFTPEPAGLRFYHTHNRAGADLSAGQYSGQVGPVYIEPKENTGRYDQEIFLVLKEFQPTFSQGGDMAQEFLSPAANGEIAEGCRRIRDERFAGQGHGARIRSWLQRVHDQRANAGARRTDSREARAARVVPHLEWQRNGDSQLGATGPCV